MVLLYNSKALRLGCSIFRSAFASKPRIFVVGDPHPSHFPLQNQLLCRHKSSGISENQLDFTVSYLIDSCGLSPEGAISASKRVKIIRKDKADSVLALFRNHGFSQTQISKLVRSAPRVLSSDPEKTLLPKIEFFRSLGVSREDLARTVSSNAHILTRSLERQMIPSYNFLKSLIPPERTQRSVVSVFKRCSRIFHVNLSTNVIPNIAHLKELGMPESCISLMATHYTLVLMLNHEKFVQLVGEVKGMGFNLEKSTSVNAMRALRGDSKMIWKRYFEIYRKWGLSEDDLLSAFRKWPQCINTSEEKIMQVMDYAVNKMGCPPQIVARYPIIVGFSLKKRIIPRCLVVKVLLSKGLISENFRVDSVLQYTEKLFLERFVNRYLEEVPQLLSVYQGNVDIHDVCS